MNVHARRFLFAIFVAMTLMCLSLAPFCSAQGKNPYAGDAKMAKLGESQFRANCAFCHGLGARGGGRGPDLTRTPKKHGNSDADIFAPSMKGFREPRCRRTGRRSKAWA